MIPLNTGTQRSKIKEWIRLYTKRLEIYRAKYGEKSFKYKHHKSLINHKIKDWEKLLVTTENHPRKAYIAKRIISRTECAYNVKIFGQLKKGGYQQVTENLPCHFVCKYLVEASLIIVSHKPLGIGRDAVYNRRAKINKWLQESEANRKQYTDYKKSMDAYVNTISATLLQK